MTARFTLRMPPYLHNCIAEVAKAHGCSMNEYILGKIAQAASKTDVTVETDSRTSRNCPLDK
jgi:predicted HicB family RNase H-like nuclease